MPSYIKLNALVIRYHFVYSAFYLNYFNDKIIKAHAFAAYKFNVFIRLCILKKGILLLLLLLLCHFNSFIFFFAFTSMKIYNPLWNIMRVTRELEFIVNIMIQDQFFFVFLFYSFVLFLFFRFYISYGV